MGQIVKVTTQHHMQSTIEWHNFQLASTVIPWTCKFLLLFENKFDYFIFHLTTRSNRHDDKGLPPSLAFSEGNFNDLSLFHSKQHDHDCMTKINAAVVLSDLIIRVNSCDTRR